MRVEFTVPGPVIGKQRPRVLKSGRSYTPAATRAYEEYIAKLGGEAIEQVWGWPPDAEYVVSISAFLRTIKSKKSKRHGRMRKGDLDNIVKAVLDALNGVAWYDDDDVVWLRDVDKHPVDSKADERIEVRIDVLEPERGEQ